MRGKILRKFLYFNLMAFFSIIFILNSCSLPKYLNYPPTIPKAVYPEDKSYGIPINLTLKWDVNDPENGEIKYELYFGKSLPLEKAKAKDLTKTEYEINNLEYATRYYWKIVAIDEGGARVESPIYSFYTKGEISLSELKNDIYINGYLLYSSDTTYNQLKEGMLIKIRCTSGKYGYIKVEELDDNFIKFDYVIYGEDGSIKISKKGLKLDEKATFDMDQDNLADIKWVTANHFDNSRLTELINSNNSTNILLEFIAHDYIEKAAMYSMSIDAENNYYIFLDKLVRVITKQVYDSSVSSEQEIVIKKDYISEYQKYKEGDILIDYGNEIIRKITGKEVKDSSIVYQTEKSSLIEVFDRLYVKVENIDMKDFNNFKYATSLVNEEDKKMDLYEEIQTNFKGTLEMYIYNKRIKKFQFNIQGNIHTKKTLSFNFSEKYQLEKKLEESLFKVPITLNSSLLILDFILSNETTSMNLKTKEKSHIGFEYNTYINFEIEKEENSDMKVNNSDISIDLKKDLKLIDTYCNVYEASELHPNTDIIISLRILGMWDVSINLGTYFSIFFEDKSLSENVLNLDIKMKTPVRVNKKKIGEDNEENQNEEVIYSKEEIDIDLLKGTFGYPSTPTELGIFESRKGYVILSWKDNSLIEDGYEIWRKIGEEGEYKKIGETSFNVSKYKDAFGDTNGKYLYYKVRAYKSLEIEETNLSESNIENMITYSNWSNEIKVSSRGSPQTPRLPYPENGQTDVDLSVTLTWIAEDSDCYDLYFGTENPPPIREKNLQTNSYRVNNLKKNTVYYWKVIARNEAGEESESPIWSFKTRDQ